MTLTQAISFLTNIFTFALYEFFFRTYFDSYKMPALKFLRYSVILICAIALYVVNLFRSPSWNVIVTFLLLLGYSMIFCKNIFIKKIAFSIIFVSITALAELLCGFVISILLSIPIANIITESTVYIITGLLGGLILWAVILIIIKKFPMNTIADSGRDMLILSLFPASAVTNMLIILEYDQKLHTTPTTHLLTIFLLLVFIFLSVITFFLYNSALHKRELESRLQLNEEMRAMNESLFKQQEKEMQCAASNQT